jgi:hypothetical protein
MPYISEDERPGLDRSVDAMIDAILFDVKPEEKWELPKLLGRINYCFSRVAAHLTLTEDGVSYRNVAMITGVLENIKQEFYRRVASPYEDKKIRENGDIFEYKLIDRST